MDVMVDWEAIENSVAQAFDDGYKKGKADAMTWIAVSERRPEVGEKVLVFAYGHDTLTARMQKQTENGYPVFECNGNFLEMAKLGRITHWMPLPEAPTAEPCNDLAKPNNDAEGVET